jgi:hypothetical protein
MAGAHGGYLRMSNLRDGLEFGTGNLKQRTAKTDLRAALLKEVIPLVIRLVEKPQEMART